MKQRLQIFARAPEEGQCKTRLIPALGAAGAARLQRAFIAHALATAKRWRDTGDDRDVELWCAPDVSHAFFADCARGQAVALRDQASGDLGARMWLALTSALQEGRRPVLIGTDCPWLEPEHVEMLQQALQDHDAGFIEAEDGGYVAVGLARAVPELFAGVAWSTARVMRETRDRAARCGARIAVTGRLPDVDLPADLARLRSDVRYASLLAEPA